MFDQHQAQYCDMRLTSRNGPLTELEERQSFLMK